MDGPQVVDAASPSASAPSCSCWTSPWSTSRFPAIQQSLHSSFADLQWVIDAYALTLASFLLTAGVVGDMFGRRGRLRHRARPSSPLSSLLCGLCRPRRSCSILAAAPRVWAARSCSPPRSPSSPRPSRAGAGDRLRRLRRGARRSRRRRPADRWRDHQRHRLAVDLLRQPADRVVAIAMTLTLAKVEGPHSPSRRIDWIGFISFSAVAVHAGVRAGAGQRQGLEQPTIVGPAGRVLAVLHGRLPDVAELRRRARPRCSTSRSSSGPAMVGVSLAAFTLSASIFAMFLYLTLYLQEVLGYGPFGAGSASCRSPCSPSWSPPSRASSPCGSSPAT